MAANDKRIDEFATLEELQDDDLLLVSSDEETYNIRGATLKAFVAGDASAASTAAQAAQSAAEAAQTKANAAKDTADDAKSTAQSALSAAQSAQTAASSAESAATAANTSAGNAQTSATAASASASQAATDAAAAAQSAQSAASSAASAEQTATNAQTTATAAQTVANTANTAAQTAASAAAVAVQTATAAQTAVQEMASANAQFVSEVDEIVSESVKDVAVNLAGDKLVVTYQDGQTKEIAYSGTGGGLAFNGGRVDEDNYLHFTQNGEDVQGIDPIKLPAGGSGNASNSQMFFAITSDSNVTVTGADLYVSPTIKFTSVITGTEISTGNGDLQVFLNDTLYKTLKVVQGESINLSNLIAVSDLKNNANSVRLVMTDSYESVATRRLTITKVYLELEWNIPNDTISNNQSSYTVNVTPKGGSGIRKTITMRVIGPSSYDRTFTKTTSASDSSIPIEITGLTNSGAYVVTAVCSMTYNGVEMASKTLTAAIAQVMGANDIAVASPFAQLTGQQYTALQIPYRVVKGNDVSASVTFSVEDSNGDEVFSLTDTVDTNQHLWTYKPTVADDLTLKITCGAVTWQHTIEIEDIDIEIEEIDGGLVYKMDASSISSLAGFTLSQNFDTYNGGLVNDSEGNRCLRVIKGDRLTIPYELFGLSSDITGKEFKIIYKVENVTSFNATAIQCVESGIGLNIKANKVFVNSSLTEAELFTCEDEKTELDVNITSKNNYRLITMWESGMPHMVKQYEEVSDKFNQDNPVGITIGSDDCTVSVYLIRSYNKALSNSEILTNFIVDAPDAQEIVDRYNRNCIYSNGIDPETNLAIKSVGGELYKEFVAANNPNAHIITISAPGFPIGKKDENYINGTMDYELPSGGTASRLLRAVAIKYKLQGTSSIDYIDSAGNVDINIQEALSWADGHSQPKFKISDNSIPVDYLNLKVNDASSEHINNIILAKLYNQYQPFEREVKHDINGVRDTVEGDMCIFFYHNSNPEGGPSVKAGPVMVAPGDTVLYALGNINNSKDNPEVFGNIVRETVNDEEVITDTDEVLIVELNNNIGDKCRFKTGNVSSADFGSKKDFGIRYISDSIVPEGTSEEFVAAELWAPAQQFIVDCNPDNATGNLLSESVTYEIDKAGNTEEFTHDTSAYRIAKFRNEASQYFVVNSALYHYVFTSHFCMPDNRSKNVFVGYNQKTGKWHFAFGYDMDTAMGNNNEGALNLDYGYLDTDHIGHNPNAGMVYNAADSTLWKLIREAFPEEVKDMYQSLETAGLFDTETLISLFDSYQKKFCEALWIEDFDTKYIKPLKNLNDDSFLKKGLGPKRLQRRQFLRFQQPFMSSFFNSSYAGSQQATFRSYGTQNIMTVTPYSDQFVTFVGGNIVKQVRGFAGVPVNIDISDFKAGDTETHIQNAPFIQDLGDLSDLKMDDCMFAHLKKVKSIILGSTESGYENAQLKSLSISNCIALEVLNIANCSSMDSSLNLSNNILLKELTTTETEIKGVVLANGCRLESAVLNAIKSLTMKNIKRLSTLQFDAGSLTSLIIENCNYNNIMTLLNAAIKLTNLRAIGVELTSANTSLIKRLAAIKGWDVDGNTELANSVITGSLYIGAVSQSVLNQLKQRFNHPDGLNITYGEIVPEYTVRFLVDGQVYESQSVEQGSSATYPAVDPTKESSISTDYAFASWSGSINNIQQDTDIVAVFNESTRQYTIIYQNGLTPAETKTVDYGGSCYYTGEDPYLEGYLFDGWEHPSTHEILSSGRVSNIASNITLQAHYSEITLPASKIDDYDYLASEDPADYVPDGNGRRAAAYTWGEFYAICQAGLALGTNGYFAIKDKIKVVPIKANVITDETIIYQLIDTKHNEISGSDGNYVSATTWQTVGVLNSARVMRSSGGNVGGYPATPLATWLDETLPVQFSPLVRSMMERVVRISTAGNQSTAQVFGNYRSYLATAVEMGWCGVSEVPYSSEINPLSERARFAGATGSMVKKTYNGAGTASNWWLASPHSGGSSSFCDFSGSGYATSGGATSSYYLAPCFDIGKSAVSPAS